MDARDDLMRRRLNARYKAKRREAQRPAVEAEVARVHEAVRITPDPDGPRRLVALALAVGDLVGLRRIYAGRHPWRDEPIDRDAWLTGLI